MIIIFFRFNKSNLILFILVIALISSIIVSAISIDNTQNNSINATVNNITKLAKVYDEDKLEFDKDYRTRYLQKNNNFTHIKFKNISGREDYILKVGANQDKIRGVTINGSNFAIDLLYCNSYERYCTFRINGVPTKKLFSVQDFGDAKTNSFDLDNDYKIKIESIDFDFCDNRRFCHLGYEGYNIVDVIVEKK